MSNDNSYRMTVQMTNEEERMIVVLREKHMLNMSRLVKKAIKETYEKLEGLSDG
jgi:hypothetical protein